MASPPAGAPPPVPPVAQLPGSRPVLPSPEQDLSVHCFFLPETYTEKGRSHISLNCCLGRSPACAPSPPLSGTCRPPGPLPSVWSRSPSPREGKLQGTDRVGAGGLHGESTGSCVERPACQRGACPGWVWAGQLSQAQCCIRGSLPLSPGRLSGGVLQDRCLPRDPPGPPAAALGPAQLALLGLAAALPFLPVPGQHGQQWLFCDAGQLPPCLLHG